MHVQFLRKWLMLSSVLGWEHTCSYSDYHKLIVTLWTLYKAKCFFWWLLWVRKYCKGTKKKKSYNKGKTHSVGLTAQLQNFSLSLRCLYFQPGVPYLSRKFPSVHSVYAVVFTFLLSFFSSTSDPASVSHSGFKVRNWEEKTSTLICHLACVTYPQPAPWASAPASTLCILPKWLRLNL